MGNVRFFPPAFPLNNAPTQILAIGITHTCVDDCVALPSGTLEAAVAQLEDRIRKTRDEGHCYGEANMTRAAADPEFKVEFDRCCAAYKAHHDKLMAERDALGKPPEWPGHRDHNGNRLLAVDCEWHGQQHIDGQLRTIQFAWSESDAVVIEFRDEQNWFTFQLEQTSVARELRRLYPDAWKEYGHSPVDAPISDYFTPQQVEIAKYATIGNILAPALNAKDVRYIGHHYSADSLWMEHWLGLEVYRKCSMDTEFAQQCVDESSELDLERGIAMKYTTLGYYSQDLIEWKRENRKLCEDGYGYIPSEILLPYSIYDVLAPYRAYPRIRRQMEGQQLTTYYDTILNPFVTDVFHNFGAVGLPMDRERMDEMRELFHFARRHLEVNLKNRIHQEAKANVLNTLVDELGLPGLTVGSDTIRAASPDAAMEIIKAHVKFENVPMWIKRIQHLFDSKDFNIRSPDMMRRWLFDIEGLVPIKSTNQKAKGMPSMAWDKVLELPADRQKLFTPAVDKQTLQILSEKLDTLDELLDLNAVGNVCKAFLKEAEVWTDYLDDGEEVENVKEQGLHSWLIKTPGPMQNFIACMYSTTECLIAAKAVTLQSGRGESHSTWRNSRPPRVIILRMTIASP